MAQKGFYYDMTACVGCKACYIACKDKNDLPLGVIYRNVYTFEGGRYPKPWIFNISISCNHCSDPRCVTNCPTGASYKREEDGLVLVDQEACIGCQYCVWSCPYGARHYLEEQGVVGKCNGCVDLVERGQNPACVDACVMRALEFGDLDELKRRHPEAEVFTSWGAPGAELTGPSMLVTLKPQARR